MCLCIPVTLNARAFGSSSVSYSLFLRFNTTLDGTAVFQPNMETRKKLLDTFNGPVRMQSASVKNG